VLRWLPLVFTVVVVQVAPTIAAQQAATEAGTLQRRYTDGAVSHYLMTGNNDGWQYTIQATDVVKRDTNVPNECRNEWSTSAGSVASWSASCLGAEIEL
jgi:hypothetical protein